MNKHCSLQITQPQPDYSYIYKSMNHEIRTMNNNELIIKKYTYN
jgi:hypothetical protein